jgi:uncharacterized protein (TIGR03435 family)
MEVMDDIAVFYLPSSICQPVSDVHRNMRRLRERERQTFGLAFRLLDMVRSLVVFVLAAYGAFAQSEPLAFEAASIKPSASADSRSNAVINDGGIVLTNVTLRQLVDAAYDIQDPQLVGPDWLETARFDIEAKPPAGHPKEYLDPMLKTLLEDRFKMAAHREMRTIPVYALVIGKDGLKSKEVEPGEGKTNTSGSRFIGTKVTMNRLTQFLSRMLDRPVIDKTGTGNAVYDIDLHYAWEELTATTPKQPPNGPPIFTALQEQLGLKLQAEKLPVKVVVIDQIERVPTGN